MAHTHGIVDVATQTVTICSILHTVLPPWEKLNNYPRLQKAYKLFIYIIGYVAVSGRSLLYPSLSTQEGARPSPAALNPDSPSNPINKEIKKIQDQEEKEPKP